MISEAIRHIGKEDQKGSEERFAHLNRSGIFRDQGTRSKLMDCLGDFSEWSNQPAIDWINARANELRKGKKLALQCGCCKTTDPEKIAEEDMEAKEGAMKMFRESMLAREYNSKCFAKEIIELIINLSEEDSQE